MEEIERNTEAGALSRPLSLNGEVYEIPQATLADMTEIGAIVRKRAQKQTPLGVLVNDPAFKLLSPQAQNVAVQEAARAQCQGGSAVDTFTLAEELLEPGTLAFAVWVLARKARPGLTLAEVAKHITPENAAEVYVEFSEACGMHQLGRNNPPLAGTSG